MKKKRCIKDATEEYKYRRINVLGGSRRRRVWNPKTPAFPLFINPADQKARRLWLQDCLLIPLNQMHPFRGQDKDGCFPNNFSQERVHSLLLDPVIQKVDNTTPVDRSLSS